MSALSAERFEEYFCALHGDLHRPFPWQRRLANRVVTAMGAEKAWPDALALPTASGKTACLDIAVFALACQASSPNPSRTAPRRIFFVVDRRIIVDEAFERAQHIRKKLSGAGTGILSEIADALRKLNGDFQASEPLACFELRGGIYRDDAWARTPAQATIITSTVDQIGSRLLFRSYGASHYSWPIHAGLAGNDSLIILDEAHCSQPFMETLQAIRRYGSWAQRPLQLPFHAVLMSATPPPTLKDVFKADQHDQDDTILGTRLKASKVTKLVVAVKAKGDRALGELSEQMAEEALRLAGDGPPKAIALIVNRVATARRIWELLQREGKGAVVLLTGRMRPIDRDSVIQEWLPRLHASQSAVRNLDRPVFVVATQCLEVGANLDFDMLVTECASLDALRQRFGRLNRMGRPIEARGVVVIRADQTEPEDIPADQDPIYANALPHTWAWLNQQAASGEIDLGVNAIQAAVEKMEEQDPDSLRRMHAPAPHAPAMMPAYLDCWVQTSPEPCPSPEISVFLHGPRRGPADVSVCWRADLDAGQLEAQKWIDTVSLCPPVTAECMQVPLHVFRRWFGGDEAPDPSLSDLEGSIANEDDDEGAVTPTRVALRWGGPEESQLVTTPSEIRPGDTLILPASQQGWQVFGHVPEKSQNGTAIDRGDEAHLRVRAVPVLRLHPNLLADWIESEPKRRLQALSEADDLAERIGEPDFLEELKTALTDLEAENSTPEWIKDAAHGLVRDRRLPRRVHLHPFGGFVLRGVKRLAKYTATTDAFSADDDASSATVPVPLFDHGQHVAQLAGQFGAACGLAEWQRTLNLAALLHDGGKADLRIQALYRGGNLSAIGLQPELLAKSDRLPTGWRAFLEARARSGYPAGGRHELVSLRLAELACPDGIEDVDLLLHLIASHHGRCRPLAPVVDDAAPVNVIFPFDNHHLTTSSRTELERIDSGVAERFWRLVRRYGWWGLAYFEATLRLSDHRASEAEQEGQ